MALNWSGVLGVLFIVSSSISFLWGFPSKLAELDLWIQVLTLIFYGNTFILFVIFLTIYWPCELIILSGRQNFMEEHKQGEESVLQKHLSKLTHINKKKHCFDFTSSFAQNFQFLPPMLKMQKVLSDKNFLRREN